MVPSAPPLLAFCSDFFLVPLSFSGYVVVVVLVGSSVLVQIGQVSQKLFSGLDILIILIIFNFIGSVNVCYLTHIIRLRWYFNLLGNLSFTNFRIHVIRYFKFLPIFLKASSLTDYNHSIVCVSNYPKVRKEVYFHCRIIISDENKVFNRCSIRSYGLRA